MAGFTVASADDWMRAAHKAAYLELLAEQGLKPLRDAKDDDALFRWKTREEAEAFREQLEARTGEGGTFFVMGG